jgi:rubrerythrin
MRDATARCLRDAFCLDSISHVRYRMYADKADEGKFPSIARLFRALAASKYVRATGEYRMIKELLGVYPVNANIHFTLNRTMDNLERSRDSESEDAKEVFEPCLAIAEYQREEGAVKLFRQSVAVCRQQAALMDSVFLKTQRAAEEPCIGNLYMCLSCGWIAENIAPEQCPVCNGDSPGFALVE